MEEGRMNRAHTVLVSARREQQDNEVLLCFNPDISRPGAPVELTGVRTIRVKRRERSYAFVVFVVHLSLFLIRCVA